MLLENLSSVVKCIELFSVKEGIRAQGTDLRLVFENQEFTQFCLLSIMIDSFLYSGTGIGNLLDGRCGITFCETAIEVHIIFSIVN